MRTSKVFAIAGFFFLAGAGFALPARAEDETAPPLTLEMTLEGAEDETARRDEDPAPLRLEYPQQPKQRQPAPHGPQQPFIDWAHLEVNLFAGLTLFSGDFDADPTWCAGLQVRVPVPGLPLQKWGVFAEAIFSNIDRDLGALYSNTSANFFCVAGGADFTFVKNDSMFLRGQGGLLFASFGNVDGVDNGAGALLGLSGGVYWIRKNNQLSVTYNPQFTWDTNDWIMFHTVGLNIDF